MNFYIASGYNGWGTGQSQRSSRHSHGVLAICYRDHTWAVGCYGQCLAIADGRRGHAIGYRCDAVAIAHALDVRGLAADDEAWFNSLSRRWVFAGGGADLPAVSATAATAGKSARSKRPAPTAEQNRIEELERELTYTKENLHATIEEQQASNEELKSTNEEMQSTNEELQSTNEELETSKEELQSVNEELVTVNAELQNKIEQLAGMQNDMKNLLDNINVGTVFLNDTLNIKRFTREAVKVYRLVASDVGRPLADIKSNINDDDLLADAQAVLETLVPR